MLGRALALQFHPELDRELLELWLADDRDGEVAGIGLSHDELRSRTAELEKSAADENPQLGPRFSVAGGPSAVPELVSQRVVDAGVPEAVAQRLQLGRDHPLIGFGEFTGTLPAQQQPRPE